MTPARCACTVLLCGALIGAIAAPSAADSNKITAYGRHLAGECTGCHRREGAGGAIPSLAGRPQAEIVALLHDFRSGAKTNPVMVSVARSLNEAQMAAVAAYFSSLPATAPAPSR